MNVILLEPEIPQNTGNIGRTCCATGTKLHLIEPMGFRINEKNLKRAGMDYWDDLDVTIYDSLKDFMDQHPGIKIWMATTKAPHRYTDVEFGPDDALGKQCPIPVVMMKKALDEQPQVSCAEILVDNEDTCIRIPMNPEIRSLNLANSVAIVLYEALRQNDFHGMQMEGHLHRLQWKE